MELDLHGLEEIERNLRFAEPPSGPEAAESAPFFASGLAAMSASGLTAMSASGLAGV